ncbi:copper homeostasis CutC domain-containing protein [Roridomyces roridus]|uniref:Copper homeostasis protein cutC homolog n=1 Tax=Roridomyces roridus TaxID=1738132 RepID=A0AAD7FBT1_9AGAR|nr:copper homeostasis CutC domain-containing protein [Roridomyces roridus]
MPDSTSPPILIEVCVDSVRSALNAVNGGSNRLEVCANLGVGGGTTPSLGLLKSIMRVVDTPIMVWELCSGQCSSKNSAQAMIRPRTGDFLYSDEEIEVMLEDVRVFKDIGVRGVVFGVLTAEGRVNVDATKRLVAEALPLEVCFHRAFDMTRDPGEALRDVMSIGGVSRILTSGHGPTVVESLDTLKGVCQSTQKLAKDLPWVLSILPGSGINADTVGAVLDALLPLGVTEIHLSGGSWVESKMAHRPVGLGMGVGEGEWSVWETSQDKVNRVRHIVDGRR